VTFIAAHEDNCGKVSYFTFRLHGGQHFLNYRNGLKAATMATEVEEETGVTMALRIINGANPKIAS
jgi:hypothetical protein